MRDRPEFDSTTPVDPTELTAEEAAQVAAGMEAWAAAQDVDVVDLEVERLERRGSR
jgi:hypothetical protein